MMLLMFVIEHASAVESEGNILIEPLAEKSSSLVIKGIVLIPGGKVPIDDYRMAAVAIQKASVSQLWVGIVHCFANLCDPLDPTSLGLNAAVVGLVQAMMDKGLSKSEIFIVGHSLGGVGARHFVDGNTGFAGLGLLGTQYQGDHEDFKGTLGYPLDLTKFPLPLLVLTGELDGVPFTHAYNLFRQREAASTAVQRSSAVVVIPKMDHSDFCQGFHVAGDNLSELSPEQATSAIGAVVGAWLDVQSFAASSQEATVASKRLEPFVEATRVLMQPFAAASLMEGTQVCELSQKILSGIPETEWNVLQVRATTITGPLSSLEHAHPNYTFVNTDQTALSLWVPSYPRYPERADFSYSALYAAASDVACKLTSADRIAQLLKRTPVSDDAQPTCRNVNERMFAIALDFVAASNPAALARFQSQGVSPVFGPDSSTLLGPQWVFTSALSVTEKTGSIVSPTLYSSLSSPFYPGNRYCKFLSPARAVEYIMSAALTKRYP